MAPSPPRRNVAAAVERRAGGAAMQD